MSRTIHADVVYASWLSNHIGPSRSLTRFSKNPSFFQENGVKLSIHSLDKIEARDFSEANMPLLTRIRSKLINLLLGLADYSEVLTQVILKKKYLFHSERVVKYYLNHKSTADVIVFHELFTCYQYLKNIEGVEQPKPVILFHHANGDTFKMLKLYHPQLRKRKLAKILSHIETYTLSKIDKYAFISDNARKLFLSLHPEFPINKTAFFHNGIENINFNLDRGVDERDNLVAKPIRLICVGTINNRKGQRLLVDAFLLLPKEERGNFHFTFLGGGPEKESIQGIIEREGLQNYFELVGAVNNVEDYLVKSDVFILTSKDEGLPISIIEAMRAKLPIIGTNVAGIPEMIEEGISGLVIQPTEEDIMNALLKIKTMDLSKMGERSRALFEEKFTLERMMFNYCKIIKETFSSF